LKEESKAAIREEKKFEKISVRNLIEDLGRDYRKGGRSLRADFRTAK